MKCIEKAKNYWKENKDEIVLSVKIGAVMAGTYIFGVFVGAVCDELKWNIKLKDKFVRTPVQDVLMQKRLEIMTSPFGYSE